MPWVSLIGAALKLIGLASAAEAWLAHWQAKREGATEQRAKDDMASAAEAQEASQARADASVDPHYRDELQRRYTARDP